ncbi:nitroreductase/quinone reductase family protein [Actinosynnema sp. NPDC020468]|uniref:nitroreductase/quinone reductase family protein n=1 Tax=Actinosynnema sp. NPDC020468 TaxID=3154488 RepID=UPI0033FDA4E4
MTEERRLKNQEIIREFRANDGEVGGNYAGIPLLLLHHTGARTGESYVSPLVYLPHGEGWAVAAAAGGRPNHPSWYHNLLANPDTELEVNTARVPVTARVAKSAEHNSLTTRFHEETRFFTKFTEATTRTIPLVILDPR